MSEKNKNTENKILDAAESIFMEKGLAGARMQEIANKAGINKALLHYYYRSKEKLLRAVFKTVFPRILPKIIRVLDSERTLFEKITIFIDNYIDTIFQHPSLPLFIINELNRNPKGLFNIMFDSMQEQNFNPLQKFQEDVRREIQNGNIIEIDHRQLFINTLSLCIFPIVGRPILQGILFDNNSEEYTKFLEGRKEEVTNFIINSIKKKQVKS